MIKALASGLEPDGFSPFPDARGQKTDVTDSELWWLPVVTTGLVAIKAAAVWLLFGG